MTPFISSMNEQQLDAVAAIESACFAHPWSRQALAEELSNPHAVFLTAVADGTVAGYIGMHHILDECAITNVAVLPAFRRCGIARALLSTAIRYAEEHRVARLLLEVRVSNRAAIALYTSLGFEKDGVRPHFYRNPPEDAALYSRTTERS